MPSLPGVWLSLHLSAESAPEMYARQNADPNASSGASDKGALQYAVNCAAETAAKIRFILVPIKA